MKYKNIVILTGAGISAESGIKTFRDAGGLWENHPIEDVATPQAFYRNPELVLDFYNQRRRQLLSSEVQANPAHFSLAHLEKHYPGEVTIVTQNIDDLHERAGSRNVIHMHGELLKMRCKKTDKIYDINSDISTNHSCDCCNETSNLRPHIVWFGEMPLFMDQILEHLHNCDLFLSIGTSAQVYPAAGFVREASRSKKIEINLDPSHMSAYFDENRQGKAGTLVPQFTQELLSSIE